MNRLLKKQIINALKIFFAAALIFWMVETGKIDFSQLGLFFDHGGLLFVTVTYWIFVASGLASLRWYILLHGIGLKAEYFRALQLNLIGLFFNSTMPGAVGGDIIKAMYIMRDHSATDKTPAMLTILLDRLVGLMGLFLLAGISVSLNLDFVWQNFALRKFVLFIYLLVFGTAVFFTIVFLPIRESNDIILKIVNFRVPGFSILKKIYLALRSYRKKPQSLVYSLLISMAIQFCAMSFFIYIARVLGNQDINIFEFATIYPIAILVVSLPLSPGGMGVGHLAFEQLFTYVGLQNGANVFNIYLISMVTLNLIGVIPYFFVKKKQPVTPEQKV